MSRPELPIVAVVVGTRPEAIKLAPVVHALAKEVLCLRTLLVASGQHREMLDAALGDFDLEPDVDLDLMRPGQAVSGLVAEVLAATAAIFRERRPALVIVHGDTGTAVGAALAAFYERIPVGHVEAGLRSGSLEEPFPEEANRRLIDTVARILWAPTPGAAENLRREGLGDRILHVTGNTVIDALLHARERCAGVAVPGLPTAPGEGRMVLVTAHRREAFGEPFRDLCRGLLRIADENEDVHVVYPVHLNPEVRRPVEELLAEHPRIHLLEPVSYLPFVRLLDGAHLVITDSGGIQEEAPTLGKPVLVMRDRTERPEAVEAGTVRLVGTSAARIASEARRLLTDEVAYQAMARAVNPYGDGRAAARIVASVRRFLGEGGDVEEFGGGPDD